jgi:hypothetical protein
VWVLRFSNAILNATILNVSLAGFALRVKCFIIREIVLLIETHTNNGDYMKPLELTLHGILKRKGSMDILEKPSLYGGTKFPSIYAKKQQDDKVLVDKRKKL